ncbi:uncharacterized protein DFL_002523 [Arthrobotrys flagrans]|uniref:Uncharacterized protein n=1 Tax=Arthrobotrys flagrans TaxID=97331 RepID=A0A437AAQ5_ARTFL|nr:hypothetical protein DFL_002523 [Arthrobotrys flagrans]
MALGKISVGNQDENYGYIDLISINGTLRPLFSQDVPQAPAAPASVGMGLKSGQNPSMRPSPELGLVQDSKNVPDLEPCQPTSRPTFPEPTSACTGSNHLLSHIGGWAANTNKITIDQLLIPNETAGYDTAETVLVPQFALD